MYIYNITTNIEESVHNQWLQWMQNTHIPEVLATGKFLGAKLSKVLVEEDMGGVTYSVQYIVESKEILEKYYTENANELRNQAHSLFGSKMVSFRTEMEIISEF